MNTERGVYPLFTAPPESNRIMRAATAVTEERVLLLLAQGEMDVKGLLPWSTNYTFLAELDDGEFQCLVVYKPARGERPLWDFPHGTLHKREYAAYLVSRVLDWCLVPPTLLRDGVHGVGSVQLFVNADPDHHYFNLEQPERHGEALQRMAAFDWIINNADRKSGHCVCDAEGQIWAIDHGITFHSDYKLRTVIWDFAGTPLPAELAQDLDRLRRQLEKGQELDDQLRELLSARERKALRLRIDHLLRSRRFPNPGSRRHYPWPPV